MSLNLFPIQLWSHHSKIEVRRPADYIKDYKQACHRLIFRLVFVRAGVTIFWHTKYRKRSLNSAYCLRDTERQRDKVTNVHNRIGSLKTLAR